MVFPHWYQSYEVYAPGMDGNPGQLAYLTINETQLYDLRQDPGERRNVMGLYPEKEAELLKVAEEIRVDLGDDLTGREGTGRREPGRGPNVPVNTGARP
jgi:arylsulfatase